jgi:hypothetical protein
VSPEAFGWLARLHGHVAVLGLAVLLHPVITLRLRGRVTRGGQLSADLGAILLLAAGVGGAVLYPAYRSRVKPPLWLAYPGSVLRFESKEHLAVMAVALAVGGALTLRAVGRSPGGRDTAWALLASAWVLGCLTASFGVYVAGTAQAGW